MDNVCNFQMASVCNISCRLWDTPGRQTRKSVVFLFSDKLCCSRDEGHRTVAGLRTQVMWRPSALQTAPAVLLCHGFVCQMSSALRRKSVFLCGIPLEGGFRRGKFPAWVFICAGGLPKRVGRDASDEVQAYLVPLGCWSLFSFRQHEFLWKSPRWHAITRADHVGIQLLLSLPICFNWAHTVPPSLLCTVLV